MLGWFKKKKSLPSWSLYFNEKKETINKIYNMSTDIKSIIGRKNERDMEYYVGDGRERIAILNRSLKQGLTEKIT